MLAGTRQLISTAIVGLGILAGAAALLVLVSEGRRAPLRARGFCWGLARLDVEETDDVDDCDETGATFGLLVKRPMTLGT